MVTVVVVVDVGLQGVPGKNALITGASAFHRYVATTVAVTEVPEFAVTYPLGVTVTVAVSNRGVN
jgi:hypothetical protein